MHISCSIGAFFSYYIMFAKQKYSTWVLKKINKWSYLAVNDLIEFLNHRIYRAPEKEAITPKYSTENLS